MEWFQVKLNNKRVSSFPNGSIPGYHEVFKPEYYDYNIAADYFGGIINCNRWGWISRQNTHKANLLILQLNNGFQIANYTFLYDGNFQRERCSIRGVEELYPGRIEGNVLLAVCIDATPGGTVLAIYTPTKNQVLRYIEVYPQESNVYCMSFINQNLCEKTILSQFDGCLAMGTETGSVVLLNIDEKELEYNHSLRIMPSDFEALRCEIKYISIHDGTAISGLQEMLAECRNEKSHLALVLDNPAGMREPICSLLPLEIISGIGFGMQNGNIYIYDLNSILMVVELRLPRDQPPSSVIGLSFIQPPDDPHPCFYIYSIYNNEDGLTAALHALSYRRLANSIADGSEFDLCNFKGASTRIRIELDKGNCSLVKCYSIPTNSDHGSLLISVSWHSNQDHKNKLVLFDINQWYKDEMPSYSRTAKQLNYLCCFVFGTKECVLSTLISSRSIVPFVSIQRHDDYFFPKALSFDCYLLTIDAYNKCQYTGVQRHFLSLLNSNKSRIFLHPQDFIDDIAELKLIPQFYDYDPNSSLTMREKYEIILSMALEQECVWLLNTCAKYCLDGSFLCNITSSPQLTLSVLTNWIVKRADQIKQHCTDLCQGIFDYGGYSLEDHELKEFQKLNIQLSNLLGVQTSLIQMANNRLSKDVIEDLSRTENVLDVLFTYHRILYFLIDKGILPESSNPMEHKLHLLRREYDNRRLRLLQLNQREGVKLYIDEQMCQCGFKKILKREYSEEGNYPPKTLQTMMRLMFLSDLKKEHKYEFMLYFMLDISGMHKATQRYQLYEEFAVTLSIPGSVIKCARTFWHLDRQEYQQTLKVLNTGSRQHKLASWQTNLLIETLLANKAHQLAIDVINLPCYVSVDLELKVLLANNNIPQAFEHARKYLDVHGTPLVEHFFRHCIAKKKFNLLASLCMTGYEQKLLYKILCACKTLDMDCVQLILFLKRSKYIEAVTFMEEVAAARGTNNDANGILTSYRTTMTPITQSLADTYFRIRPKLSSEDVRNYSAEPLSSHLAKLGGNGRMEEVFRCCVLSAHCSSQHNNIEEMLTIGSDNIPFLRSVNTEVCEVPQLQEYPRSISSHKRYIMEKRRHEQHQSVVQQPKRRRLLNSDSAFITEEVEQNAEEETYQSDCQVRDLLQPPNYLVYRGPQPSTVAKPPETCYISHEADRNNLTGLKTPFRPLHNLPQPVIKHDIQMLSTQEDNAVESMDVEEEDADEIIMEIEQESASPNPEQQQQYRGQRVLEKEPDEQGRKEQLEQQQQVNDSDSDTNCEFLSPSGSVNTSSVSFLDASREYRPLIAPPTGPQPRSSLLKVRSEQESSGFGSFATAQTSRTIESLRLNEFVPPVCSSKMCETTSARVISSVSVHQVKISERTTICGEIDDTSVGTSPIAWSMPSTLAPPEAAQPQALQMLDTTLGMSSYDMTALDPTSDQGTSQRPETEPPQIKTAVQSQPEMETQQDETQPQPGAKPQAESQPSGAVESTPTTYINLDEDDEMGGEKLQVGLENVEPQQPAEAPINVVELDEVEEQSLSSSNEPAAVIAFNRVSPSYSVSSDLSDISSPLPTRQDPPVYSIVVESTNSISDSPSPTSHTPTSFLPSDTNVSQNSSPRAAHGNAGDGSNRSLYRANSLETVDDLDTTKGSLEEDNEDEVEEDECVIALDGTEVRGYVPRPETVAACNSAELFAFKPQDECEPQTNQAPCPSLGATANSDSVMGYTINLDSADSAEVPPPAVAPTATVEVAPMTIGSSNESLATVAIGAQKEGDHVNPEGKSAEKQLDQKSESKMGLMIEATTVAEVDVIVPAEETPVDMWAPITIETSSSVETVTEQQIINLDSDMDSNPSLLILPEKEETEVISEVIDDLAEFEESGQQQVMEQDQGQKEEKEKAQDKNEAEEEEQDMNETQDDLRLQIALHSVMDDSNHPVNHTKRTRHSRSAVSPIPERSIRLRSDSRRTSVSSNRSSNTPSPIIMRRRLLRSGSNSEMSEDVATPEADAKTTTSNLGRHSKGSVSTNSAKRGGSMPPSSKVPVSTPKSKLKLLRKPLDVIDETSELSTTPRTRSRTSQLINASNAGISSPLAGGEDLNSSTPKRQPRCRSEPPLPMYALVADKSKRGRNTNALSAAKLEGSPAEGRTLRNNVSSGSAAEQVTTPSTSTPTVAETSTPPKKRRRSKK